MPIQHSRRQLLKLMGVGGVVFASGLAGAGESGKRKGSGQPSGNKRDFFFLQLSDTHWGFQGPPNPQADKTLRQAVATINQVDLQPDFIVFTGDLTHTTDSREVRRTRMAEFRKIVSNLRVKDLRFMPGEHDAALDAGEAFKEHFGAPFYAFDHKGIHFVTVDNVSDPKGAVGDAQRDWLAGDLRKVGKDAPIVVFTHRPLFDLYPSWDWATQDGAKVVDILLPYRNVTVFYGHIHQEHHRMTDHIAHHSAKSLMFPLPAPGSVAKKQPIPWDPAHPFKGLGYRQVEEKDKHVEIEELVLAET
jgi:hypothetical protein